MIQQLRRVMLAVMIIALVSGIAAALDSPQTIQIDPDQPRQTITGFGGAYVFRFSKTMDAGEADQLAPHTFAAFQPTHLRFGMMLDQWEPENDNGDPFDLAPAFQPSERLVASLELMQEAQAAGAVLLVSIWDVPDWAVSNPDEDHGRIVPPALYDEVIEGILAYLQYARDEYGVIVDYISLNENDLGVYLAFEPGEQAAFIAQAAARMLDAGLETRWLLGEVSGMQETLNYVPVVWGDDNFQRAIQAQPDYLDVLAFHSWDSDAGDAALRGIAEFAKNYDLEVWSTETGYDSQAHATPEVFATWDHALGVARIYSRLYKLSGVNVPFFWQLLDDYRVMAPDLSARFPVYDILWQFRQYVPVGAQIVETSRNAGEVFSFAARWEDGFTAHLTNTGGTAVPVELVGLPEGQYYQLRSSAAEASALVETHTVSGGEALALRLPASSVNVLTTRPPVPQMEP